MKRSKKAGSSVRAKIEVSGINIQWDINQGTCSFENLPVAMMWLDTTLAGLMSGVQAMVGTERFALALQAEGRQSVEADWQVISQFSKFRDGFKAIANIAAVAGWGEWRLISLDEKRKECHFRIKDSWEGRYQKALGVCWGSGMLAGKMAGYASKLFSTNCWAEQTTFIAKGDRFDEFLVKPSERTIEKEIEGLLLTDEATKADMAVALQKLQKEIEEREQVENTLRESQERLDLAVRGTGVGLWDWMVQTGETIFNERWAEIVGYTLDEISPVSIETWTKLCHPDDLEKSSELLEKHFAGGTEYYICEARMRHKNGDWIWVLDRGKVFEWDDAGKPIRMAGTHIDITERKQAEETLRSREQRYRQLVDNAKDIIYRTDADGHLTYINPTAVKIMGYPAEEVIGKHYLEVIRPEYRKDTEKFYGVQFVKRMPNTYYEFPVLTKDGKELWLGQNVQLIVEGDSVAGFQALARDITERKQAGDLLKQSEERFRKVFEHGPLGMIMATLDGRFLKANDIFTKMLGYSAEELYSLTLGDITHPDHIKNDLKELDRLINDEIEVYKTEKRYVRKDKNTLWGTTTVSAIRDENGKILFFLAMIEDITERKLAEEALQQSEERYRSLVENTMDGYFICEIPSGRFLFLNQRICEIYGYTLQEGLNLTIWDVVSPEDHERIRQRIQKRLEGANFRSEKQVYSGVHKDGSIVRSEISTSLVSFQGGPAVQGVLRDITEQERLEEQLRQAQRMKAIGTLAGGVAHDFNNLLMGIQGNASLMLLDTDINHEHYEKLKSIEQYVENGSDLTKQLLGFARGGKYEVKPTDLNGIVKKSSEMFGRTKKEINIYPKYQENIWIVEADQGQIEQVLLNLYVNAWQAMPKGGALYLQTENITLDVDFAKLFSVEAGRYVKISVKDTGVGMDQATQQRIFDPFFTTKELGRGIGLGLASAYGIVKNHDGIITVHSKKDEGSTFDIYLPATEKSILVKDDFAEEISTGTETLLLIDDEEMIIDVGGQMLKKMGYKIFLAMNGKEALAVYKKNQDKIDMVILDMIMPDMGGGEVFDRLKEMNPGIKVLLSSGYSIDGQAAEILKRGCDGFIQKPFKITDLSQRVREILDK